MKRTLVALVILSVVALTGCTSAPAPKPSGSIDSGPTPAFPAISGDQQLDASFCPSLTNYSSLLAGVMPGFTVVSGFTPDAGSLAETVTKIGGASCGFSNDGGEKIVVSIGEVTQASADALTTYFTTTVPAATYAGTPSATGRSWFNAAGGMGEAIAMIGRNLIVADSSTFTKQSDANGVMAFWVTQFAGQG